MVLKRQPSPSKTEKKYYRAYVINEIDAALQHKEIVKGLIRNIEGAFGLCTGTNTIVDAERNKDIESAASYKNTLPTRRRCENGILNRSCISPCKVN